VPDISDADWLASTALVKWKGNWSGRLVLCGISGISVGYAHNLSNIVKVYNWGSLVIAANMFTMYKIPAPWCWGDDCPYAFWSGWHI
jgi:hypothetical protein